MPPPEAHRGDPRQELHSLTRALRRAAGRAGTMGRRRVHAAARPAAPPQGVEPGAQPAQPAGPMPDPTPAPSSATCGPWPAEWGGTPDLKGEADARALAVRERAGACPDLGALERQVSGCKACGLCQGRTQTVFMDGTGPARIMFVGEAPGYHEDQQGVPFVGRAGQLLTDIVQKGMGLSRTEVVIANVLKCRPPENRDPLPAEKRICTGWLDRQIELVNPEVLIALGRHAAGHLLDSEGSMGSLRGRIWQRGGRKVLATYHPAFLLRSPRFKRDCWQDIQLAMGELGLAAGGSS